MQDEPLELIESHIRRLRDYVDEMHTASRQHTMPGEFYRLREDKERQLADWEQVHAAVKARIDRLQESYSNLSWSLNSDRQGGI